jgi:hypothetical protein
MLFQAVYNNSTLNLPEPAVFLAFIIRKMQIINII